MKDAPNLPRFWVPTPLVPLFAATLTTNVAPLPLESLEQVTVKLPERKVGVLAVAYVMENAAGAAGLNAQS